MDKFEVIAILRSPPTKLQFDHERSSRSPGYSYTVNVTPLVLPTTCRGAAPTYNFPFHWAHFNGLSLLTTAQ